MEYRIELSPEAYRNIEEGFAWIARESPTGANRWFEGLMTTIRSLQNSPQRCPHAPEDDAFDEEIRQLLHGKRQHAYRILFTIDGSVVRVLHVRHGARRYLQPESGQPGDDQQ